MLSTSESPHDLRAAYESKVNGYMLKPCDGKFDSLVEDIYRFWLERNLTFKELEKAS